MRQEVARYPGLSVNYVDHHNPDLLLFDDAGEEMSRIDLTRLKTTANMHKLLSLLGVREVCTDDNADCASWASSGQCDLNPSYMYASCRKSCGKCTAERADDDAPS